MDYFIDVLTTFLGLVRGSCVAVYVYGGSESSRISSKNILICVPKMNKGLVGLQIYKIINLGSNVIVYILKHCVFKCLT